MLALKGDSGIDCAGGLQSQLKPIGLVLGGFRGSVPLDEFSAVDVKRTLFWRIEVDEDL
jgi:hypothetical protein